MIYGIDSTEYNTYVANVQKKTKRYNEGNMKNGGVLHPIIYPWAKLHTTFLKESIEHQERIDTS